MADTMPSKELDLIAQAKAAQAYANTNLAALGLVAADLTPFTTKVTGADTAMAAYQTARTNASAARAAKDTGLTDLEKEWRQLRRKARANPNLTDAQREGLGIPVPGNGLLKAVALAFSEPLVEVDNTTRLAHVISFREASTPRSKARPKGVKGAEVWLAVLPKDAAPPRDNSTLRYMGQPSSSPYDLKFAAEDAGKIAWYLLRWVDSSGTPGGWSEPAGAMIMG